MSARPNGASGCSADGLPHRPGVYLFRGPAGEVLYVGTAVDLRRRVGQYFNGADPRARIKEMVALATAVDHVECAHELEAGVRELRLLAAHAPPYNRRSRFPHRWWWVVLTDEAFPRFVGGASTRQRDAHRAVGPFRSRADAADTAALLARFTGVRTCTTRLARSALHGPAVPEREVSPCPAARDVTAADYAAGAAARGGADRRRRTTAALAACGRADRRRWPTAAATRPPPGCATTPPPPIEALWRGQRLRALAAVPELVAARPDGDGGWQLAVIRHGQLAAAGMRRRGVPPMPVVDAICAAAQVILPDQRPLGGALVEETALIARWLAAPGRADRAGRSRGMGVTGRGRPGGWAAVGGARPGRRELAAEQALERLRPSG